MTKYRVGTDNGDILFYGTDKRISASWTRINFRATQGQHEQIARHIARHTNNWSAQALGLESDDGLQLFSYDLPSQFQVWPVSDRHPEDDAAVRVPKAAPKAEAEPKAHLVGRDTYTKKVSPIFLKKGEHFRAEKVHEDGSKTVRYGVAAIEGFGLQEEFYDRYFREKPQSPYTNVFWDDVPPEDYTWRRPNHTLMVSEGWDVYAESEVSAREARHRNEWRKGKELREAEQELKDAREAVRLADVQFQKAKKRVAHLALTW